MQAKEELKYYATWKKGNIPEGETPVVIEEVISVDFNVVGTF